MEAYLDNSATTKVCEKSIDAMVKCMRESWGNPSSLHMAGISADEVLQQAREEIAKSLSCNKKEIFFTSGGTESNNLAILGAARRRKTKTAKKVITSTIEHARVEAAFDELEKEGFEVVRLSPDENGKISLSDLEKEIDENTILVSIMAVNNEIGSIQPFDKIKSVIKRKNSPALLHVDAVQAFGKIILKPKSIGIDLMTVSSHKIHGPKGTGALFIDEKAKISPIIFGGEQENRVRPGTEAMPAIAGFSAAVKELPNINAELKKMTTLRDDFLLKLNGMQGVFINSPADASPYIVNISLDGLRSETVLNFLSNIGIYVSSGSACAKGHKSHVLKALGLSDNRVDSAIRISFSRETTEDELDFFIQGIEKAQKMLRRR